MPKITRFGRRAVWMLVGVAALCMSTAAAQDEAGQVTFNNACRTCHSLDEGDNRLGPHLHGIIGREAGSLPDFAYSANMKNSDLVWDEQNLDAFIENPDDVISGNRMKPYGGMTSAEDRAAIVAFLKSQSGGN